MSVSEGVNEKESVCVECVRVVYMCVCVFVCVCVCAFVVWQYTCMYKYICTCTRIYVRTFMYIYIDYQL